ncbi:hypothetical protein [Aliikangiella sp. IMCC44359]|uniref:hypothetical protein n=1 Tax=Aliikangiella sp. IMCC44359 TaxID=3459125 RepID=UPI00403ACFCA
MYKNWIVLCLMLFLIACTSKTERLKEQIATDTILVEKKLQNLSNGLKNQTISNAAILKQYASQLSRGNSEYQGLIQLLAKNADIDGPMYQSLVERLNAVKKYSASGSSIELLEENLLELEILAEAAHPTTFNDALSDPINVLADISEGKLPRVQSIKREQEKSANSGQDYGKGAQLIGNPQYGSWKTNSSGMSFWEWYGAYALFSNLMDGRRYSYSDWGRGRPYSYYHDYGRNRYTKPSVYKQQDKLQTRTEKSFKQQGKRFSSPYAKKRTGASGLSKTSQSRPSSGSFRKASSFRKSGSSSGRRAQSRTSRGPSRGK